MTQKVIGVDVIESFYDRTAELLRHPAALGRAFLDTIDATIALLRVIVAGVDDDHVVRDSCEQILRQLRDVLLRDSDDDDVSVSCCFMNCHGCCASLAGQVL